MIENIGDTGNTSNRGTGIIVSELTWQIKMGYPGGRMGAGSGGVILAMVGVVHAEYLF